MNIKELEQEVEKYNELINAAENEVSVLEEDLDFAFGVLGTLEKRYEALIEQLYQAHEKEINERGAK